MNKPAISFPITPELHSLINQAAALDNRSMAGWIKLVLEKVAKNQIKESSS